MIFSTDRAQLRRFFCEVWHQRDSDTPLEPLPRLILAVIQAHPEYQALLNDTELDRDYLPEHGATNPFLHMGMHIAIQEQLASQRPAGIVTIYRQLSQRLGDSHSAEHQMMECLGETLWEAQRNGQAPDEAAYLRRLRRLVERR